MNRSVLLLVLLSIPSHSTQPTPEQQLALQQEKDNQEFRLKVVATFGTITLALIAAYVQIYMAKK